MRRYRTKLWAAGGALLCALAASQTGAQEANTKPDLIRQPWLDAARSPDQRAALVLAQMTLDEKIQLLHGAGFLDVPLTSNGGAGYTPGIARLGIPDLNMADSTVGVTRGASLSRYATLLPATIAEAATWDPRVAYDYAALVGRELRAQGYNVSLAGGANLTREPRNGRTFEYRGEDPLLTGKMAAQAIRGVQDQQVIGDLKHLALNDQETGRQNYNVEIDYRAARESDLLAFEIAVNEGQPGMVMCAYNRVWSHYACENAELLTRTLRQEWDFKGWVVSDWGATHSAEKALLAGLDQEQPGSKYFGESLKAAVNTGQISEAAIDTAAARILRTMFAVGVIDNPPRKNVVDVAAGLRLAQKIAEEGSVLLKNDRDLLPITQRMKTVAIIGGHADVGVITGGGSGQVDPPRGNAVKGAPVDPFLSPSGDFIFPPIWWPSSPLQALRAAAPGTRFVFDDGREATKAAALAAKADMVVFFAYAPSAENTDNKSLSLPEGQDAVIDAVASRNKRTVVVLETSGAVTMPWIDKVDAVVAAWFPGAAGAEALANLLTGRVNFGGKLPLSFPRSEADLPHPQVQGVNAALVDDPNALIPSLNVKVKAPFDVRYDEGALVGYKWFQAKGRKPLFAFGHGLSYTRFGYSDLKAGPDSVTFSLTNMGRRAGAEIAQVYVQLPEQARLAPLQLAGWVKVNFKPGETRRVTVPFEQLAVSAYDVAQRAWRRPKGSYQVFVGSASDTLPLKGTYVLE